MPVLALLLALLVFVPDVAMTGSWASPARVADMGDASESTSIAPAQLVRPTPRTPPVLPQVLLLIVVVTWLSGDWLLAVAARSRPAQTRPPAGRFARGVLQAFLN